MKCEDIQDQLIPYLLDELDEHADADVYIHLQGCQVCRDAAHEMQSTVNLLKDAFEMEAEMPVALTEDRRQSVRSSVEAPQEGGRLIKWFKDQHVSIQTVAAVLVLCAVLSVAIPMARIKGFSEADFAVPKGSGVENEVALVKLKKKKKLSADIELSPVSALVVDESDEIMPRAEVDAFELADGNFEEGKDGKSEHFFARGDLNGRKDNEQANMQTQQQAAQGAPAFGPSPASRPQTTWEKAKGGKENNSWLAGNEKITGGEFGGSRLAEITETEEPAATVPDPEGAAGLTFRAGAGAQVREGGIVDGLDVFAFDATDVDQVIEEQTRMTYSASAKSGKIGKGDGGGGGKIGKGGASADSSNDDLFLKKPTPKTDPQARYRPERYNGLTLYGATKPAAGGDPDNTHAVYEAERASGVQDSKNARDNISATRNGQSSLDLGGQTDVGRREIKKEESRETTTSQTGGWSQRMDKSSVEDETVRRKQRPEEQKTLGDIPVFGRLFRGPSSSASGAITTPELKPADYNDATAPADIDPGNAVGSDAGAFKQSYADSEALPDTTDGTVLNFSTKGLSSRLEEENAQSGYVQAGESLEMAKQAEALPSPIVPGEPAVNAPEIVTKFTTVDKERAEKSLETEVSAIIMSVPDLVDEAKSDPGEVSLSRSGVRGLTQEQMTELVEQGKRQLLKRQLVEASELSLGTSTVAGEKKADTVNDARLEHIDKLIKIENESKEAVGDVDGDGLSDDYAGVNYTVSAGDTLSHIAVKHGVSVKDLVALNHLQDADTIRVDQVLVIPDTPVEKEAEPTKAREGIDQAYGVNPFVYTADNAFSTFGIDVDTASYTRSRNYMLRGFLPPAEAVRTEEFVNFFDYAYAAPRHATFQVYAEAAPSAFGRGLHTLKIGVKGRHLGREEQKPAVLTFAIDTSGSMNTPDRLGLVQKSLNMLLDKLGPNDQVAIIQYNDHARLLLAHTPVSEKAKIKHAIESLKTTGSTNLEQGMGLAYEIAGKGFQSGSMNRVLLLSDGVANLGAAESQQILDKVSKLRKQGIFCSVFGFGIGSYDDKMLESLADKGDGAYAFIDSLDEAKRVFVDDLSATLNTIASDVKIQVEFNPKKVSRYRQLGYENRQLKKEQFRDDTVDAGEVGSGQAVTALYEMEMGDAREQIGTVRVRYRDVATGKVVEIATDITRQMVHERFDEADARFKLAAGVAEFSEILRGSPHAKGSDFADVGRVLRPVALELNLDQNVQELIRLVEGAGGMSRAQE
jgi:Ca-activated chloride channel family protein